MNSIRLADGVGATHRKDLKRIARQTPLSGTEEAKDDSGSLSKYSPRHPVHYGFPQAVRIILTPSATRRGYFAVRLRGEDQILCISKAPTADAARLLADLGNCPNTALVTQHCDSESDCLLTTIGAAAALTVKETAYGPRFRRWKASSTGRLRPSGTSNSANAAKKRSKRKTAPQVPSRANKPRLARSGSRSKTAKRKKARPT